MLVNLPERFEAPQVTPAVLLLTQFRMAPVVWQYILSTNVLQINIYCL